MQRDELSVDAYFFGLIENNSQRNKSQNIWVRKKRTRKFLKRNVQLELSAGTIFIQTPAVNATRAAGSVKIWFWCSIACACGDANRVREKMFVEIKLLRELLLWKLKRKIWTKTINFEHFSLHKIEKDVSQVSHWLVKIWNRACNFVNLWFFCVNFFYLLLFLSVRSQRKTNDNIEWQVAWCLYHDLRNIVISYGFLTEVIWETHLYIRI